MKLAAATAAYSPIWCSVSRSARLASRHVRRTRPGFRCRPENRHPTTRLRPKTRRRVIPPRRRPESPLSRQGPRWSPPKGTKFFLADRVGEGSLP